MTWLDDVVFGAARKILNAGSELAARGGLNFASPLKATDNAGADRSDVTLDYPSLDGVAVVAALPAATNANAGKMTAAHVAALELAAAAGGATERTGTVDLSAAQAWADLGLPIPIDASTTSHFAIALHVAIPAHTYDPGDGALPVVTQTVVAVVGLAVTRDGASVCTVAQKNGGASWDLGRVEVRAVNDGAAGWQIQIQRAAVASVESPRVATVSAFVRSLSTDAWAGDDVVAFMSPDGDPLAVAAALAAVVAGFSEAPTASSVPIRDAAGRLRAKGYTLETDIDNDRRIVARRADGTTVDEMAIDATAVGFTTGDGLTGVCSILDDGGTSTLISAEQPFKIRAVGAGGLFTLEATTEAAIHTDSLLISSAADAYGVAITHAAAKTIEHSADITSLTDRIAPAGSGAGKMRKLLGGLGASGSANGQFFTGLEDGNTVLGGLHGLHVGSLVGGVSDKLSVLTGSPGSGTSIFDVFAVSTNATRLATPGSYSFNIFSANGVTMSSNTGITLSAATISLSGNDYLLNPGQYLTTPESIAFAASLTLNFNLSDFLVVGALTNNVTTVTVTNAYSGSRKSLKVTQGGAGGFTIAFGSEFKFGGTYTSTPDPTTGHVTIWEFDVISSTEIRCVGKETYTS